MSLVGRMQSLLNFVRRHDFEIFLLVVLAAVLCAGCDSLLVQHPSAASLPVQLGAASTNDVNLVSWLELARTANAAVNPSPLAQPVDQLLNALTVLASAFAGWYARHRSAAAAAAASVPPKA